MFDISFQGARLTLECKAIEKDSNIVLEFSDEGTPVEFPDMEVVGDAMTLNGELVTWTKPVPVRFNITVIPGSNSDTALRNLLYAGHVGGRKGKAISRDYVRITSATLQCPSIDTHGIVSASSKINFSFKNGRLSGGPPAIGANAEGKMSARTYKFVFESMMVNEPSN